MKYVKQLSIILGISFLAELLEILIPLPIAASVYGLVIMLVGLITDLIPLEKVETAADFLVDAMSIMFVPATVGIMASADALKEMLLPICVITLVSTVLIMIVTGRVSQRIIRSQRKTAEKAIAGNANTEETVVGSMRDAVSDVAAAKEKK